MIHWKTIKEYDDITFKMADGVARIAFNRPEVRNAFRPKTVDELLDALVICHESQDVGVVLISAEGPLQKMVDGLFVQVEIKGLEQKEDTKALMELINLTF